MRLLIGGQPANIPSLTWSLVEQGGILFAASMVGALSRTAYSTPANLTQIRPSEPCQWQTTVPSKRKRLIQAASARQVVRWSTLQTCIKCGTATIDGRLAAVDGRGG